MRYLVIGLLFLCYNAFSQKMHYNVGITYRQENIDIENYPYHWAYIPDSKLENYNFYKFWTAYNLKIEALMKLNNKLSISLESYLRKNGFIFIDNPSRYYFNNYFRKYTKTVKSDLFFNVAYNKKIKKRAKVNFKLGYGLSNMGTSYNKTFYDTIPTFIGGYTLRPFVFKGTFLKATPKLEIAYEYKKIAFSIEGLVVEAQDLIGQKGLWLGFSFYYKVR